MPLHRRLYSFSKSIQAVSAASFLAVGLLVLRVIQVLVLQISIIVIIKPQVCCFYSNLISWKVGGSWLLVSDMAKTISPKYWVYLVMIKQTVLSCLLCDCTCVRIIRKNVSSVDIKINVHNWCSNYILLQIKTLCCPSTDSGSGWDLWCGLTVLRILSSDQGTGPCREFQYSELHFIEHFSNRMVIFLKPS